MRKQHMTHVSGLKTYFVPRTGVDDTSYHLSKNGFTHQNRPFLHDESDYISPFKYE